MYVELIAIPAITMPGSGVIIVGRNTACSAITCCRLMYCDTLSPHNVLVTQQTLPQNKTSRRRERERERSPGLIFKISPRESVKDLQAYPSNYPFDNRGGIRNTRVLLASSSPRVKISKTRLVYRKNRIQELSNEYGREKRRLLLC